MIVSRALSRAAVLFTSLLLLGGVGGVGCTIYRADLSPRPLTPTERGEYRGAGAKITGQAVPDAEMVEKLARVFYVRMINRRFNSISTFHDPALREFFQSPEAFADYFAALVDELERGNFDGLRPWEVSIERLDVLEPTVILVSVKLRGDNSLPLRFWSVGLARSDRWEKHAGRWWIIPGKL